MNGFDRHVHIPATASLGHIVESHDIKSSLGPFHILPEYRTIYPNVVIRALGDLYDEYNRAFKPLVDANREWATDYQYCIPDGLPINWVVQIDMVGLPEGFLQTAMHMSMTDVREILRRRIFEIENSVAVYQLLEKFFSRDGRDSFFKMQFRSALAHLREQFGKPIALLAVTDQKYQALRESEFGKNDVEFLSDAEVEELSGFDRLFGPDEFQRHVEENGGRCQYLLYARTSDPVAKLKKPDLAVEHPLLSDPQMRRIIKAHAITFNVDSHDWPIGDVRRINDTKAYMPIMGMAFRITDSADLSSADFLAYLETLDQQEIAAEKVHLRAKPLKGTYGCYGHVRGYLTEGKFRRELRHEMRKRGDYVVQPEMPTPRLINSTDGMEYTFIDRNFFGIVDGTPQFLGGFRNLMPLDSFEAHEARIHGNGSAVYAEIV